MSTHTLTTETPVPVAHSISVSNATGYKRPEPSRAAMGTLRKSVKNGTFSQLAANNNIDPAALIALSDEVTILPQGQRPTFDFVVSPDTLTVRVANKLYPELKKMGFDPVLLVRKFNLPSDNAHPQLRAMSGLMSIFNQAVLSTLNASTAYKGSHFLSPEQMSRDGIRVLSSLESINSREITEYITRQDQTVGVVGLFRLYEKVKPNLIDAFRDNDGNFGGLMRRTNFKSAVNPADTNGTLGMRGSIICNLHPSQTHHGVIPPFWPQLEMMEKMHELDIDWRDKDPQEVAKTCEEHGLNPYLDSMMHHVVEEFDQGARIIANKSRTPIDLRLSVWENYHALEDYIVTQFLALAASYKLGLPTHGIEQDLAKTIYHSYPGLDSNPPKSLPNWEEIRNRDKGALERFTNLGGRIINLQHMERLIFGDPESNAQGFVIPQTETARQLKERFEAEVRDLMTVRDLTPQDMGVQEGPIPPGEGSM